MQGEVDTTLPPDLQAKQAALKSVLDELQFGNAIEDIYAPGVLFDETPQSFREDGIGLHSWDFNGKPSGDDVPVVLNLRLDTPDSQTKRVERVYSVTGVPGNFVIRRKK
jgi:hypothetical protein